MSTEFPPLIIPRAEAMAYSAAYESAVIFACSDRGRIWMRERDRAALLNRLSTNQLEGLHPGQGCETVLTTPIGRMLDLLTVLCLEDAQLVITSPGRGPAMLQHLRKQIFFNDKVEIEDATLQLSQLALYGPLAKELLTDVGLPSASMSIHGVVTTAWHNVPLYIVTARPLGGSGFWLLAPPATLANLNRALRAAGAYTLDADTYQVLRVEAGHPVYGREISLDYIPLETGLWDAVSFAKGCYVGQEIIARMESRKRLAKAMRGLRFTGTPGLTSGGKPLAKLEADDKEAGDLTSVVESPRYGLIGLGYVRSAYLAGETPLHVAGSAVELVELPFGLRI
ncbi:MAG: folate-binding protein [Candidatus Viridilinea halotolerans]|uniref:Folate-binding protein n=1 Tax=Candidatus Viridilinea halotolerans TaxID=2491704 RepID=A0A426TV08_9CHLR|nr:MAG: folate-binding protein [Candidatus Viridilinea halotolerans]